MEKCDSLNLIALLSLDMKKINRAVIKMGTLPFDRPGTLGDFNKNARIAGVLAHPLRERIIIDQVDIHNPPLKKLITAANLEVLPAVIIKEASEGKLK